MSGLCALLRLDGGPPEGIEAMAAPMRRRGPDGTFDIRDGPAALGLTLLATTPESLHESLPLRHAPTGCAITADARLDNRDELLEALLPGPQGRVVGDGELILRAYLAWDEGAPARLLGDFAFAIWDPRARRLLAARDQMGMRRLAWAHVPGRLVAVATEPRAVREAPGVPRDLDDAMLLDYLDERAGTDFESTMYRAVRRLPPGHLLLADDRGVTLPPLLAARAPATLRLRDDAAYAEAVRETFTEAVRARLRHAGRLGSMLSGGMDSGATVAVAARLLSARGDGPLHAVSVIGPDPRERGEAESIRAMLRDIPGLAPHLADVGEPGAWLAPYLDALRHLEEPADEA